MVISRSENDKTTCLTVKQASCGKFVIRLGILKKSRGVSDECIEWQLNCNTA